MQWWEILLAVGLFVLAFWYLYRKFSSSNGCTCGNSGGCSLKAVQKNPVKDCKGESCSDCSDSKIL